MNKCIFCDKEAHYFHFVGACWKHWETKKFKELDKQLSEANKIMHLMEKNIQDEFKKIRKLIIKGYIK